MPIITVSRGSYNHGRSIAEKLAKRIGYTCMSRDQIIDSLEEFHLPEIKLVRGLDDAFSILDRFPHGKKRFKAAIKSAILLNFVPGNVVYHGLVGHHFVKDISHVLKVRIIADTRLRVTEDMSRQNTTEENARFILKKDDEERRKWGMFLYGIDIQDPENYDLLINIGALSEDDAVDLIAQTVSRPQFQETTASQTTLQAAATKALITTRLFDFPNATVKITKEKIAISLKVPENQQEIIRERIVEMLSDIKTEQPLVIEFDPYF
jgi:cytidylate kinase